MLGLGFGFVEVGTLTPRPQAGNPRPRLFRLAEDRAVINRMGFNNRGQADALRSGCSAARTCTASIGVNIGANKDSADRIADYVAGVRAMAPVADYLTINISSPNTPGLRQLQDEGALGALLAAVDEARRADGPPIFLKVAPDLGEGEPDQIVRVAIEHSVDALIVANTTVSRPPLKSRHRERSGRPVGRAAEGAGARGAARFPRGERRRDAADRRRRHRQRRRRVGADPRRREPRPALHARWSMKARASRARIARGLAERLKREGFANIAEAVGTE